MEKCWFCLENLDTEDLITTCKNCGVTNDRTPFINNLTEEEEVKPKLFEVEILKNITVGETAKIIGEIRPTADINASFKGFLMGEVEYKGEKYYVSINKTSYKNIAGVFGSDTKDWVDKEIMYMGEQKCGAMMGRVWQAFVKKED